MADELLVLQGGKVVERGRPADVLRAPVHPYTKRLLDAVPQPMWQHSRQIHTPPAEAAR